MANIAFLTPMYFDDLSYIGGGERYPRNLAVGIAESSERKHRVEILSFGPESHLKTIHPGVNLRVLRAERKPRNALDSVSWEITDAVEQADLLHIHQAYTRSSETGYLAAKFLGKPICVTDHGGTSSTIGINLHVLDMVDRVICQSDFAASHLRTKTQIEIVKGGVDHKAFTPPSQSIEKQGICFVGRLLPHKGVDRLIAAMPRDYPLTICGRAYHADYFEVLRREAKGKNVTFVTDADDQTVKKIYQTSVANVLSSVYRDYYGNGASAPELMGFALLEAMACGTAAICSRVGGMPEFVKHGETGFIYDTVDELSEQLGLLIKTKGLASEMGAKARKAIEQEFDHVTCGRKICRIYERILDQSGKRGGEE